eukprot:scaffold18.g1884.t1
MPTHSLLTWKPRAVVDVEINDAIKGFKKAPGRFGLTGLTADHIRYVLDEVDIEFYNTVFMRLTLAVEQIGRAAYKEPNDTFDLRIFLNGVVVEAGPHCNALARRSGSPA